jgi:hypothetical protein
MKFPCCSTGYLYTLWKERSTQNGFQWIHKASTEMTGSQLQEEKYTEGKQHSALRTNKQTVNFRLPASEIKKKYDKKCRSTQSLGWKGKTRTDTALNIKGR